MIKITKRDANNSPIRPILVTGSHHGGTSWLGSSICHADATTFLWEPFSCNYLPPWFSRPPEYWFTYPFENQGHWAREVHNVLSGNYQLSRKWKYADTPKRAAKILRDSFTLKYSKFLRKRILFKDPIAVFASAWLADQFDFQVIVTIRHPAAFVASILKTGNAHPWSHFAEQKTLMDGPLHEYRTEIENFSNQSPALEDGAILLWKMIYDFVNRSAEERGDWLLIRHEDLCASPKQSFERVFEFLELAPGEPAIQKIIASAKREDQRWKSTLTDKQIAKIRERTSPIWEEFYDATDW